MKEKAQQNVTKQNKVSILSSRPLGGWLFGIFVGLIVALIPLPFGWIARLGISWNTAMFVVLVHQWYIIIHATSKKTRQRAASEDPGRVVTLLIALVASASSLIFAIGLSGGAIQLFHGEIQLQISLGILTICNAWCSMHTAFTLHYAHLYYRAQDNVGGLQFPGDPPDDFDFAYFAFTLGMTYQTSDVTITNRSIRRVVLGHCILSFIFNTVILALAVNLILSHI